MTDTVMMELAKMQTKIRTYENNEKKHIMQEMMKYLNLKKN
jgi:hypothetical protein